MKLSLKTLQNKAIKKTVDPGRSVNAILKDSWGFEPINMNTDKGRKEYVAKVYPILGKYLPKSFFLWAGNFTGTTKKVIDNCVQGAELKDMSAFDVEYLFLKIRSVSVGETADIFLTCKECETANECKVDLSKIEVRGLDSFKTKIKITDDLMFSMLTPDLDSYTGVENNAEGIIEFIAKYL